MPLRSFTSFFAEFKSSFLFLITKYSNITRLRVSIGKRFTASIMEFILCALFIGISSVRSLSSTAWSEMAICTPKSIAPSLSILLLSPLVLTVWRLPEMASPSSSLNISIAFARLSRLSSGSPIPIYTIFIFLLCLWLLSCLRVTTCATISPAVKSRVNPPLAVRQNEQPTLQPTCVETQIVYFAS